METFAGMVRTGNHHAKFKTSLERSEVLPFHFIPLIFFFFRLNNGRCKYTMKLHFLPWIGLHCATVQISPEITFWEQFFKKKSCLELNAHRPCVMFNFLVEIIFYGTFDLNERFRKQRDKKKDGMKQGMKLPSWQAFQRIKMNWSVTSDKN